MAPTFEWTPIKSGRQHGHVHQGDLGLGGDSDEGVGNDGLARKKANFGMLNLAADENRIFVSFFDHHLDKVSLGTERRVGGEGGLYLFEFLHCTTYFA